VITPDEQLDWLALSLLRMKERLPDEDKSFAAGRK
jgi:hypothetical protein